MVLKKSPAGFNTGNTIRKGLHRLCTPKSSITKCNSFWELGVGISELLEAAKGPRELNQNHGDYMEWYKRQELIHNLMTLWELDSEFIPESNLQYSLDKDNRWLMLEMLERMAKQLNEYGEKDKRKQHIKATFETTVAEYESTERLTLEFKLLEKYLHDRTQGQTVTLMPFEERLLKLFSSPRRKLHLCSHATRGTQRPAHLYINRERRHEVTYTQAERVSKLKLKRRYRRRGIKLKTTKKPKPTAKAVEPSDTSSVCSTSDVNSCPPDVNDSYSYTGHINDSYVGHMNHLQDMLKEEKMRDPIYYGPSMNYDINHGIDLHHVHKWNNSGFKERRPQRESKNLQSFCKQVAIEHNQDSEALSLSRKSRKAARQKRSEKRQRMGLAQAEPKRGGKRSQRKAARLLAQQTAAAQEAPQGKQQNLIPGLAPEPEPEKPIAQKKKSNRDYADESSAFITEIRADDYDGLMKESPKQRVELWDFIDVLLNKPDHGQKVKLTRCKKKQSCSAELTAKLATNRTQHQLTPHPPGVKPGGTANQNSVKPEQSTNQTAVLEQSTNQMAEEAGPQPGKKTTKNKKNKNKKNKHKEEKGVTDRQHSRRNTNIKKALQFNLPPLTIKLKTSSIRPSSLRKRYDTAYVEGTSVPRQFWLDLSPNVRDSTDTGSMTAVLVFHQQSLKDNQAPREGSRSPESGNESPSGTAQFCITGLYIKLDLWPEDQKIVRDKLSDKINGHFIYPVTKVVECFVEVYKSLPQESIKHVEGKPSSARLQRPAASAQTLSQLEWLYSLDSTFMTWKYEVCNAEQAHAACAQVSQLRRPSTARLRQQPTSITNGALTSDLCLNKPENGDECDEVKVILTLCNHTYCVRCLRGHVKVKLLQSVATMTCPSPGCETVLDPVTCLQVMSLAEFREYSGRVEDVQVGRHPQWQWCPADGCRRAVKMLGSGLLDYAVVVQCQCGAIWCFSCKGEAHWPATCEQAAVYQQLNNRDPETSTGSFSLLKTPCAHCSNRSPTSSHQPLSETDCTGAQPQQCQCQYEFCLKCLDCKDSPLQIPPSVRREKEVAWTAARPLLLPVIFYRSALCHRACKLAWSQSEAETRAGMLAKLIQRSKGRASHPTALPTVPSPRPAGYQQNALDVRWDGLSHSKQAATPRYLTPALETDKFFLLQVYKFVHQAHFLLEHVYVVLTDTADSESVRLVTQSVIKLEALLTQINKMLSGVRYSPSSMVSRLRQLTVTGQKHMVTIATGMRVLQSSTGAVMRSPTNVSLEMGKGSLTLAFRNDLRSDTV